LPPSLESIFWFYWITQGVYVLVVVKLKRRLYSDFSFVWLFAFWRSDTCFPSLSSAVAANNKTTQRIRFDVKQTNKQKDGGAAEVFRSTTHRSNICILIKKVFTTLRGEHQIWTETLVISWYQELRHGKKGGRSPTF
jgi:hypothetical protein